LFLTRRLLCTRKWQIFILNTWPDLASSDYWTTSFLSSRNISWEDIFWALRRSH
jgi:hypothetical protein